MDLYIYLWVESFSRQNEPFIAFFCPNRLDWLLNSLLFQLQLYTAKSQYWLHKADASPEQWQLKKDNFTYEIYNENRKWLH